MKGYQIAASVALLALTACAGTPRGQSQAQDLAAIDAFNQRYLKAINDGDADTLIPMALGRQVYDAAPEPKTWLTVPGAGHNDVQTPQAEQAVLAFLQSVFPPGNTAASAPVTPPSLADCGT